MSDDAPTWAEAQADHIADLEWRTRTGTPEQRDRARGQLAAAKTAFAAHIRRIREAAERCRPTPQAPTVTASAFITPPADEVAQGELIDADPFEQADPETGEV